MAPEILTGAEITQKCDIWSLGITLLELTEGAPPLADVPPYDVITIIPERPSPTFAIPGRWSKTARAFLTRMLLKDPKERRDADRLLRHPFVKDEVDKALRGSSRILCDLAEECIDTIKEVREELENNPELGSAVAAEESDEYYSDYDTSSSDANTMIVNNKPKWKKVEKKKTDASFASVLVDETQFENESRPRSRRKTKHNRRIRRTRATHANKTAKDSSLFGKKKGSDKYSIYKKRQKYEVNFEDLAKTSGDLKTKQKAQELLSKIWSLTNRNQLKN